MQIKKLFLFLAVFSLLSSGALSSIPAFADSDDDDTKIKFKKNKVHTGDGPPPSGLAKVGDLYIDSSNLENLVLYKKINKTTWQNLGPFQGETGPAGPQGETGPAGPQGETVQQVHKVKPVQQVHKVKPVQQVHKVKPVQQVHKVKPVHQVLPVLMDKMDL